MANLFRSMHWRGAVTLGAVTLAAMTGAIALGATVAGGALAQGFDLRSLFTSPTTSAVAPPAAGAPDWSGEAGSSGHPAMQADAIRAAAGNFRSCLEELWPHAARRGVTRADFDAQTASLTPDLRIMDFMDAQPEFTKAFWEYLDTLVSDARIENGRKLLAQHRATFDAVEKAYGVDRHYIAAIWGVESNYSTAIGERSVVRSTATLACIGRRKDSSARSFSPRSKSWRAAMCGRNSSKAPGQARSGRRSSCRHRSSATPSISMAMAAATSSTRFPI